MWNLAPEWNVRTLGLGPEIIVDITIIKDSNYPIRWNKLFNFMREWRHCFWNWSLWKGVINKQRKYEGAPLENCSKIFIFCCIWDFNVLWFICYGSVMRTFSADNSEGRNKENPHQRERMSPSLPALTHQYLQATILYHPSLHWYF